MKAPRVSSWIRATGPEFGFAEIVLESTPNHLYNDRRPVPPRGAFHDRRERWARDAVDAALPPRAYARGRTACSGRRSRVVLTPGLLASSSWEANASRGRWCQEAPIHQGEHDIGRKTIAQGRPDCFR
jgi:hypothetical protein